MANISAITLPNGTTKDIRDKIGGNLIPVKGTQTAQTGTWTGKISIPALYDGLTIAYYLPYSGNGNATLNLTLSDNTNTGAINCYYNNSRLTTHYPAGATIIMTYWSAGSIKINGTATTDNRWIANADYNVDYTVAYSWTAADQQTKVITASYFYIESGNQHFPICLIYGNTYQGMIKFNINGTGAKNVILNGEYTSDTNYQLARGYYDVCWDPSGDVYRIRNDGRIEGIPTSVEWDSIYDAPVLTDSATTSITVNDHSTTSIYGVQSSTTTASKVTLGTALSVTGVSGSTTASKVTVGSHSTDYGVKSAGSGSFTSGTFSGGSGSFSATVTNHVLSFSHTHNAATHGADSHTHTAPTLGSKVPTVSASDVTVPKAATSATTIPNVTSVTDVTVPIKNTSQTTVVTSKTHTVNESSHSHVIPNNQGFA